MGGLPNKEGHIEASKLIDTIKNEFELTIDIEVIFYLLFINSFIRD